MHTSVASACFLHCPTTPGFQTLARYPQVPPSGRSRYTAGRPLRPCSYVPHRWLLPSLSQSQSQSQSQRPSHPHPTVFSTTSSSINGAAANASASTPSSPATTSFPSHSNPNPSNFRPRPNPNTSSPTRCASSSSSSSSSSPQPAQHAPSVLTTAVSQSTVNTTHSTNTPSPTPVNPPHDPSPPFPDTISTTPTTAPSSPTRPRSETRCRRTVKRKVALVVAYDGSGYHGFQRNAGVTTVSDELERGLHAAALISDENYGSLSKIKWTVAARTDRGVSAAGNLVSAKLLFDRGELESGYAFLRSKARINRCLPSHVRVLSISQITGGFNARSCCEARWYEYLLPMSVIDPYISLAEFDTILNQFKGSKLFHNFTVGVDHSLPPRVQARRYVTQCQCDHDPVSVDGFPMARIRIHGQSFMLHQIRKMISLAIMVAQQRLPPTAIAQSLDPVTLVNIPPAPATGLFLDCCRFGWYNERQKSFLTQPLSMYDVDHLREAFKQKHIIPSIARRFKEEDFLQDYFNTIEAHPVVFEPEQ